MKQSTKKRSKSGLTLRIGPIEIQLRQETLETLLQTANLDAVVSSDDSVLSMSGGVSAAIAALAGTAVRNEVASQLPLPVGAVAVTSGGRLGIPYILHAVTLDRTNGIFPSARTMRRLIREVLSRCEALGIAHIAVPALATGAGDLSPFVSGKIIAQALNEHALNPTVLRSVLLSLPNPSVYQAFAREIGDPSLEAITGMAGLGRAFHAPSMHSEADGAPRVSKPPAALEPRVELELGSAKVPVAVTSAKSRLQRLWSYLRKGHPSVEMTEFQTTRTVSRPDRSSRELPLLTRSELSRPLVGGRYVLLEEVGRGGMAVVYLSWDLVLRRIVALKILRPDITDSDSLKREAAAALELTHENIVRIYHFEPRGRDSDAYLVMEYLPWPSGEKWIADAGVSRLPVRSVIDVGVRICRALAHAHGRHILHLDIKPSNIFVDSGGENAKLGDFGLARISGVGGTLLQLHPIGTPAYMAPEQIASAAKVTPATDVYQLGGTLWDFVTGSPPPRAELDLQRFEPGQRRLLSVVLEALVHDRGARPSAFRLAELVASAS